MASLMAIDTSQHAQAMGVVSPPLQISPQTTPPPSYELIPHRVFVGGLPHGTVETELRTFFEGFGAVRDVKIIRNFDGTTKFGFVTYESEEEAKAVRNLSQDKLEFKGRRLNIGPAMRKVTPNPRGVQDLAVASPMPYMVYAPVQMITADAYGQVQVPEAGGQTYTVMVPSTPVQQPYQSFQYNTPSFTPTPPVTQAQQTRFVYNQQSAVNYAATQGAVVQQAPANAVQHTPQMCQTPRLSQSGSSANLTDGAMMQQAQQQAQQNTPQVITNSHSATNLNHQQQGGMQPGTPMYSSVTAGSMQHQQQMVQHPYAQHSINMTPITPSNQYRYATPAQMDSGGQMYQYQVVNQPTGAYYAAPLDMTHYSQMIPQPQHHNEYVNAIDVNQMQHEFQSFPFYAPGPLLPPVYMHPFAAPSVMHMHGPLELSYAPVRYDGFEPDGSEQVVPEQTNQPDHPNEDKENEKTEPETRSFKKTPVPPRSPIFINTPEKKRKMGSTPMPVPRVRLTPRPRASHGRCGYVASPGEHDSSQSTLTLGSPPFPYPTPSPCMFSMSPFGAHMTRSAPPKVHPEKVETDAKIETRGRGSGRSPRKGGAMTSLVNQLNQAAINDPHLTRTPVSSKYSGHGMKVQVPGGTAQLLETTVVPGARKDKH